MEEPRQA